VPPSAADAAARRAFVAAHTERVAAPLVPHVHLRLATEVTPLWRATQAWLDERELPPPFWAFAWAGGLAVARAIADGVIDVRGRDVLDLASGSGLVAIAAALAGAARVRAVDLDPFAIAAIELAAADNGVAVEARVADAVDAVLEPADVVLAGDVFYDRTIAECMHRALLGAAARGARAFAGDPHRAYAPPGWEVVLALDVPTTLDLEGRASMASRVLAAPSPHAVRAGAGLETSLGGR